jgi:hypothetical protein
LPLPWFWMTFIIFSYGLVFWPFVVCHFFLEPVMKITYPLLNDMPCCSFACAGLFEWPDWWKLLCFFMLNNTWVCLHEKGSDGLCTFVTDELFCDFGQQGPLFTVSFMSMASWTNMFFLKWFLRPLHILQVLHGLPVQA